jgi:hypothetical protein
LFVVHFFITNCVKAESNPEDPPGTQDEEEDAKEEPEADFATSAPLKDSRVLSLDFGWNETST